MKGISVIVPVYNREKLLGDTLRSIVTQDYPGPLEIIVSDDGSTDRSLEIAAAFGSAVRVLPKPAGCRSQGVSGARNRGLAMRRYAYVSFLDSDDLYLPGHLTRMGSILDSHPESGFVLSRILMMKNVNGKPLFAPWTRPIVSLRDIRNLGVTGSYVVHTSGLLFRSEVFDTVGVFDESYSNGEDGDLWIRIGERYSGMFVNHYGAVYRVTHEAQQLTNPSNAIRLADCAQSIFTNALTRYSCLRLRDRFRLAQLRYTLASLRLQREGTLRGWMALSRVLLSHPLWALDKFTKRGCRLLHAAAVPGWSEAPFGADSEPT